MSLTNCQDCGREVSTRAQHCMHCGRPWPGSRCGALGVLAIAVALAAVLVAGVFFAKHACARRARARTCIEAPAAPSAPSPAPAETPKDY